MPICEATIPASFVHCSVSVSNASQTHAESVCAPCACAYSIREITSAPYCVCGFRQLFCARSAPLTPSRRQQTIVVVPRSMASAYAVCPSVSSVSDCPAERILAVWRAGSVRTAPCAACVWQARTSLPFTRIRHLPQLPCPPQGASRKIPLSSSACIQLF